MRTAFIETLFDVAREDRRVMLVVGDLGFGVVDRFARELPAQFLNAGVAEQNMAGVAAGLALSGKIVFTYSIANFPLLRCLEQIRNDVCYHRANVKVVAVGGGYAYGALGMSHHATEDLAIARAIPNLVVVSPNDPFEAAAATRAAVAHEGPCYLRLGRAGERRVHAEAPAFALGRAIMVREGPDATFVAGGAMLATAVDAADLLAAHGVHVAVMSVHTIKPLDTAAILGAAHARPAMFTIEEHSTTGGLGGAISEFLLEQPPSARPAIFKRIGLPDAFVSIAGSQQYLSERAGIDARSIADTVRAALAASRMTPA